MKIGKSNPQRFKKTTFSFYDRWELHVNEIITKFGILDLIQIDGISELSTRVK